MKLRLIEIDDEGAPARCPGTLSASARDALEGALELYAEIGFKRPWIAYLADLDGEIVGTCAFTQPPKDGRVEIYCQTFDEFEGRGRAGRMVSQMLAIAYATDPDIIVTAHTRNHESASSRILRRLGFEYKGRVPHPDMGRALHWARIPVAQ